MISMDGFDRLLQPTSTGPHWPRPTGWSSPRIGLESRVAESPPLLPYLRTYHANQRIVYNPRRCWRRSDGGSREEKPRCRSLPWSRAVGPGVWAVTIHLPPADPPLERAVLVEANHVHRIRLGMGITFGCFFCGFLFAGLITNLFFLSTCTG